MKSGEILRFPLGKSGKSGHLRVVLGVRDLSPSPSSQLAFVADCYLIQISRSPCLASDSFSQDHILVNGAFLGQAGAWKKHRFECVGTEPPSLADIEFPCWFDDMDAGLFFCRGQLRYKLNRKTLGSQIEQWNVQQTPVYPEQLSFDAVTPGLDSVRWFADTDVRYNERRTEILSATGVSLKEPYWKALSPRDLKRCQVAIGC